MTFDSSHIEVNSNGTKVSQMCLDFLHCQFCTCLARRIGSMSIWGLISCADGACLVYPPATRRASLIAVLGASYICSSCSATIPLRV
jgi:hypothetical protein